MPRIQKGGASFDTICETCMFPVGRDMTQICNKKTATSSCPDLSWMFCHAIDLPLVQEDFDLSEIKEYMKDIGDKYVYFEKGDDYVFEFMLPEQELKAKYLSSYLSDIHEARHHILCIEGKEKHPKIFEEWLEILKSKSKIENAYDGQYMDLDYVFKNLNSKNKLDCLIPPPEIQKVFQEKMLWIQETKLSQEIKKINYFLKTIGVKGINEPIVKAMYQNGFNTIGKIIKNTSVENLKKAKIPGFIEAKCKLISNSISEAFKKLQKDKDADIILMNASNCFDGFGEIKLKMIKDGLNKKFTGDITIEDLIKINGVQEKTADAFIDSYKIFIHYFLNNNGLLRVSNFINNIFGLRQIE